MLRSHHSVICSDIAHIARSETGAAEAIVGCKLLLTKSSQGKIYPEQILYELNKEKFSFKHATFPAVLSITQPTEVGTIYSLEELIHLRRFCKQENLLLHIDACRIFNAAVSLNVNLHDIIDAAEPDIISLGGTKNGLLAAEAVVIFNQDLQEGSDYLQKQTLQLLSKMRYLSAQYIPFFEDNLWLNLATKANNKAQEIATILKSIPKLTINYPVQTNQIFFSAPEHWVPLIQEKIACHLWTQETSEIRFLTSWNTSDDDVVKVRSIFAEIVNISC